MSGKRATGIEWTDHTWNPFVGCSIVSAGCTNCYAMRIARKLEEWGIPQYQGTTRIVNGNPVWTGKVNLANTLEKPVKLRRPSMIFVNSMSDFFHEAAEDAWRQRVLEIMRATPWHQYQVLTKRAEGIRRFVIRTGEQFPDNLWLGVTVENKNNIDRIDILREASASVRFLSIEPLITPGIDTIDLSGIHWVIGGGESGPGARPMAPAWIRSIRDQCITAGVPFFFKQWGRPENNPLYANAPPDIPPAVHVRRMDPIGKGGSMLDGREWKQFPL